MALTPEQVLNKHFQTTQFRRGYEERDVDDFLDEIVAEMRSLIEQRDDYLKQLNDCRASKNQPAVRSDGPTQAMPPVGGRVTTPSSERSAKIQDAERAFKAASDRAAKAKAEADAAERAARERIERAKGDAERAEAAARSAVDEKALNEAQSRLNALNTQVADAEAKLTRAREQTKAAEEAPGPQSSRRRGCMRSRRVRRRQEQAVPRMRPASSRSPRGCTTSTWPQARPVATSSSARRRRATVTSCPPPRLSMTRRLARRPR